LAAALGLALALTISCSGGDDGGGGDSGSSGGSGSGCSISGYKTKQIGSQVWMAENLNCDVNGSVCYDDPANCAKYGRLYDWATAMALPGCGYGTSCASQIRAKHRGICPSGWHLPSDDEWDELVSYVEGTNGCSGCAGRLLKAKNGWNNDGNGEDKYEFSALPGGWGYDGGSFIYVGHYGDWWSTTEDDSDYAHIRFMVSNSESVTYMDMSKRYMFSVRCLRD